MCMGIVHRMILSLVVCGPVEKQATSPHGTTTPQKRIVAQRNIPLLYAHGSLERKISVCVWVGGYVTVWIGGVAISEVIKANEAKMAS